jgi:16S rRNA processing protein RimM
MNPEKVVLAQIMRTRGIRGEVVAHSLTDVPGRFEQLKSARLELTDGSDLSLDITAAWKHQGKWVLKFSGIDSPEAAQRLCGADLWVPRAERGQLEPGSFFRSDLIGCTVINAKSGERVGLVEGWQEYGGPPLMEVSENGRERLIPFVGQSCEVDLAARTIRAELPEGLLDL